MRRTLQCLPCPGLSTFFSVRSVSTVQACLPSSQSGQCPLYRPVYILLSQVCVHCTGLSTFFSVMSVSTVQACLHSSLSGQFPLYRPVYLLVSQVIVHCTGLSTFLSVMSVSTVQASHVSVQAYLYSSLSGKCPLVHSDFNRSRRSRWL